MEKDIVKLNKEFSDFLKTKGINAKFQIVVNNIKESIKEQHEKDVKNFNEIKQKSIEENKDFVEFLHTKGLKAKVKLVIENIKKGARESNERVKAQIAATKGISEKVITVDDLNREFNDFLKKKGLDEKYNVIIEEVK